ncbi:MAG TPA: AfsR/SARP family transcriptional regulator, partial [Pseudonocardiaceae bacterium]|nr:AfsR/SARP family transcriptional regulator [Pseudonocardiaceae bacterium]
ALADLAFSKAVLARWRGDAEAAYVQLDVATGLLGEESERASIRAATHDLLGYLAEDLDKARTHRGAAYQAAVESGHATAIANVLVGIADLALRHEEYEQATRLVAASTAVRGLPDLANPDLVRIEQTTRRRIGEARFAEATREGTATDWSELVAVTLAG